MDYEHLQRTCSIVDKVFGWKVLLNKIIGRLKVQFQQQVGITKKNIYYNLCLVIINRMGTIYPCGSNNGFSLRFCVDMKHLKKAEGHIG